jgi:hypothetical protein
MKSGIVTSVFDWERTKPQQLGWILEQSMPDKPLL